MGSRSFNEFASYLDSTLTVVARARLIGTLAHHLRPHSASALDIGCGAGQLAEALFERGFEHYVGVDISRVAIQAAQQKLNASRDRFPAVCHFETGELGNYVPSRINLEKGFDLIVLSEVLYYLPTPDDAVTALRQCATWLNGEGLIMISLKDDGKSHAIVRLVAEQFTILSSFLYQDQETPTFGVQVSRERPAYLISTLAPKT
jgi:2-polyprenyl-3-methyl-5-hydroxy-6-metoxy-1,4-benzoquinol methylase